MCRVIGFIDGFNLYHALDSTDSKGKKPYRTYKWLNYRTLCERYIEAGDRIVAVYLFTAYVPWQSEIGDAKRERHRKLVAANKRLGVSVEWGKFRPVTLQCRAKCREEYDTYEEKRTDVKIALSIQRLAYEGKYTKGILISGDTDLAPAIEAAVSFNSQISFLNVLPVGRSSAELSRLPNTRQVRMSIQDLVASRLADPVTFENGARFDCPAEWK